jgi:multimeric flavodoxin WrbA
MRHLLLIYASQTGRTITLADAVCRGASALSDEVILRRVHGLDATLEDLLWCHGLLIGTPENFGYMAGAIKDFFDRTFYPAQGKVEGLPYAVFVSAGNDGTGAINAIARIANGYPLKQALPPVIVRGEPDAEAIARCDELGQTMAAGIAYGMF